HSVVVLEGSLAGILDKPGSGWVIGGVFVGLLGTLMCGLAGRLKERELQQKTVASNQPFALGKGLLICGIAGVFSAVYGIAVNDGGAPIAETAAELGAGHWQTNAVYIFSNTGAFVTTATYCLFLACSQGTFAEFHRPNGAAASAASQLSDGSFDRLHVVCPVPLLWHCSRSHGAIQVLQLGHSYADAYPL
ncbi:MAG: hypothetical protein JSW27_16135, partial [Phycisphaerales bacterium]